MAKNINCLYTNKISKSIKWMEFIFYKTKSANKWMGLEGIINLEINYKYSKKNVILNPTVKMTDKCVL